MKLFLFLLFVAALAVGGWFVYKECGDQIMALATGEELPAKTETADSGDDQSNDTGESSGTIQPMSAPVTPKLPEIPLNSYWKKASEKSANKGEAIAVLFSVKKSNCPQVNQANRDYWGFIKKDNYALLLDLQNKNMLQNVPPIIMNIFEKNKNLGNIPQIHIFTPDLKTQLAMVPYVAPEKRKETLESTQKKVNAAMTAWKSKQGK